ncbi:MAG: hypothetical protein ABIO86_11855 [Sphingomonas sp.]
MHQRQHHPDVTVIATPEALKAFIRARLSPQKTPAHWVWVEGWPLTGSGKIQKFMLREAFLRGDHDAGIG